MMPQLADATLVGEDTFLNEDASIAAQITRIKALPEEPDAIMLCTMMPGAVSAIKQIRAAGINSMILNGSGVDGSYWLSAVPDLSNFYVPVQGSIYGDDPNPEVTTFNAKFKEVDRRRSVHAIHLSRLCHDRRLGQGGGACGHHRNRRRGGGTGEDERTSRRCSGRAPSRPSCTTRTRRAT